MEVAADYAAATAAPDDTQEEIVWVAMEIGEHLAERGHAGEWHQIDGEELGRFTLTGDLDDRVSFLRLAAPMLAWLAETDQMDAAAARRILKGIAKGVRACSRSRKLVKRQLDRLRATVVDVACDDVSSSPGGEDVAANDDASTSAMVARARLVALLPTVHLASVGAETGTQPSANPHCADAPTAAERFPDLPPEAA